MTQHGDTESYNRFCSTVKTRYATTSTTEFQLLYSCSTAFTLLHSLRRHKQDIGTSDIHPLKKCDTKVGSIRSILFARSVPCLKNSEKYRKDRSDRSAGSRRHRDGVWLPPAWSDIRPKRLSLRGHVALEQTQPVSDLVGIVGLGIELQDDLDLFALLAQIR